jgi:hypothetical protein
MDQQNPSTRAFTSDRSPATAAVDNLLRRALKISDPRNPDEVAKGLLARYTDEATKIRRERQGLPFSMMQAQQAAAPAPANGMGRPDARKASDALDSVLTELTTRSDLSDVAPELRGWSATIRSAASDGLHSARFAIDPGERDRAFGARRILGDYSRLARYTGAISYCATETYCRVAEACDDVANIILVMAGDALGEAGLARAGGVIQVPATTLQTRRDAIIVALRNMLQPATGDDEESWPRGALAVNQIYTGLDDAGASDLRALLDEAYLSRQLDDLIDMAAGSTPDGLRALGSAAAVTAQRLERFLLLAQNLVNPPSPPASMFFMELQLFIQGFDASNTGYRLPYLARSPLLLSAFSQNQLIDNFIITLLAVALQRSALADATDCLCCCCDDNSLQALIVAGKALFDIDRAIDLYALGTARQGLFGDAEWRAAAYGAVIASASAQLTAIANGPPVTKPFIGIPMLDSISHSLNWPGITATAAPQDQQMRATQISQIISMQLNDEIRWSNLVATISPLCRQDLLFTGNIDNPTDPIGIVMRYAINNCPNGINTLIGGWGGPGISGAPAQQPAVPATIASSLATAFPPKKP